MIKSFMTCLAICVLSFVMSCNLTCHVMSSHVMSCHVLSCHVMSCLVIRHVLWKEPYAKLSGKTV